MTRAKRLAPVVADALTRVYLESAVGWVERALAIDVGRASVPGFREELEAVRQTLSAAIEKTTRKAPSQAKRRMTR